MRARLRELGLGEALLITALLAIGCDRSEVTRAALSADDARWSARIESLRSRQLDTAARLAQWQGKSPSSAAKPAEATNWKARLLRAQASVEGSRQTLTDLDGYRAEITREVEAALERDGQEGEQLFGRESAQMEEALATQQQELIAADKAVAELASPGRSM
jgi:hypothetical protein